MRVQLQAFSISCVNCGKGCPSKTKRAAVLSHSCGTIAKEDSFLDFHGFELATDRLVMCGGCKVAKLCGEKCQREAWKSGLHDKKTCKLYKDSPKEPQALPGAFTFGSMTMNGQGEMVEMGECVVS